MLLCLVHTVIKSFKCNDVQSLRETTLTLKIRFKVTAHRIQWIKTEKTIRQSFFRLKMKLPVYMRKQNHMSAHPTEATVFMCLRCNHFVYRSMENATFSNPPQE